MTPHYFLIKEYWTTKLWKAAIPAALLFSAAFFFLLPVAASAAARLFFSLIFGAGAVNAFIFRQKREHIRRHIAEAEFLGFSWTLEGNLWNPFSVPQLKLGKEKGDSEEDRLMADLVCMHGPDYSLPKTFFSIGGDAAVILIVVVFLVHRAVPGSMSLVLPLFGLAMLLFLVSKTELFFEKFERTRMAGEMMGFASISSSYRQWNFLSLEAKRLAQGRVEKMEKEIALILLKNAGLRSGSKILETGSGGGFLWKHLPQELKSDWTQAEKDPLASLYAKKHGFGTVFCDSDIKNLPFKDSSFDAVVGLESLDSLSTEDLLKFLPEAQRLLKPGGKLVHLKDFPDWPGAILMEKFNLCSLRSLRRNIVFKKGTLLEYEDLSKEDIACLREAVAGEKDDFRPYAKALSDMYSAGISSDLRFRIPMFASIIALKNFLVAAGFEILTDSFSVSDDHSAAICHIVARKRS